MRIFNAHQNNLKNISLNIPEDQLIVVTGLSGSGKSSLAMDVIANEGYRYFLESLPAYKQQNAQLIPTAEVDEIQGLPPVIKVEQSKRFRSVNATFGTLSELAAIFRILFARYADTVTMSKSLFSFNHPKGACECCNGLGQAEYIDLGKLVGDENKTLREGAITTTLPGGYIVYSQITVEELDKVCRAHDFSVDIPWKELTAEQRDVVLNGSDRIKVFYGKHTLESRLRWEGLKAKPREEGYYKGMLPIMNDILKRDRNKNILKFVSSRVCPDCKGARIKAEHLKYKWQGLNFREWMDLPLSDLYDRLKSLHLSAGEQLLVEKIYGQLYDLRRLGMQEYSLSTPSSEISSGDAQRIKLIRQVNSSLQGILYVFDEPSIGLAEDYQHYLRHILKRLISRGNTVMVVEHDLNFIRAADWIIELGPEAGVHGGEVVFNGPIQEFLSAEGLATPTLAELQRENSKPDKQPTHVSADSFQPQPGELTVVSRKTPKILQRLSAACEKKEWNLQTVSDQPIGKTPRSNPATYTGLADKIRDLLAKSPEAKSLKMAKNAFSFNNKSGRCETCEGAGVITLSMNVMGSINQVCPECNGKRFKPEVLQVHWNNKNIADIYELSIEEAADFFSEEKQLSKILTLMLQLGLGYIKLGQPSNTLSGGEAQRIKLTKHFAKQFKKTLLVLEETGIGLHRQNVRQLLKALHELKNQTAGIICFEQHPLFKDSCDTLVDNALKAEAADLKEPAVQPRDKISVKGARTHHLKDLNLDLPRNKLSVITGISGSGKSSLGIDTLHGFGLQEMTKQFSAYQQSRTGVNFQLEVDSIEGLTPTICITRKEKRFTERSELAKQTGIDRILRFAFSRKAQYEGSELSASHFSNNHELGKCAVCDGMGQEFLPDPDKIVLDQNKSITDGLFEHNKALAYYGHSGSQFMAIVRELGKTYGFDLETRFKELTEGQREILFYGTGERVWKAQWVFKTKTREGTQEVSMRWEGLFHYLKEEYYKTRKNKNIDKLRALFSPAECSHCEGSGLKPERLRFQIGGKPIHDIKAMDFNALEKWLFLKDIQEEVDQKLVSGIRPHLINTIQRAKQLHLDHLQLNRKSSTLSGGENQRVALITQLNSPLKGITYLLDEPSAGLSNDNIPDLLNILQELLEKGNTVIVIEHNKEIILAADRLVQLGPKAGKFGGAITFEGTPREFLKQPDCHPFLKTPFKALALKAGQEVIAIRHLSRHTLVREALEVPVGGITAISGKSGIGKTTLVKDILIPSIQTNRPVYCESIKFPKQYTAAHYFETKKLRSHASTLLVSYLELLPEISRIFAGETGLKPKDFSYKTKTSQCTNCKGKGFIEISLDVTANAIEICEVCKGKRYQPQILGHLVNSKNIAEVLALNISEVKAWLEEVKASAKNLEFLEQLEVIGLAHLNLEQPVQSLSSGEKQRLLLLNWLQDQATGALYILDEPSTGLHYADIDLLFAILKKLSKKNDILVIDHNPYLLGKIGVGLVL
ncbi:ATP-binding cassette domain-containing protein [Salinimicrobium sediminilitoris]|uniref:ATP-binding cassette domain-containing protein n=1 Tax=Salinimicrobium sediminilitoris TaxID=2876715 RepID=UPI001E349736|nr:ATP-binding cassette domain-containing protein [Salinimicrobium sediminilitoris]MCC8360192.1 ATP-binding cassette domain-containing protein [Salinimicrobium sediminilitoris]